MRRRCFNIISLLVILVAIFVFARSGQALTERNYRGSLVANMKPADPGPNENVSLSLVSFETDLDKANIIWTVNGQEEKSGIGEKTFNFRTGGTGNSYTIDIQVEDNDAVVLHKQLSFSLADIDLSWEAATYLPPLYRGHSLITQGSLVKLVATPHIKDPNGREIDPAELIYTWRRNGLNQPKYSGLGQNALLFRSNNAFGSDFITVSVGTADKQINVSKSIELNPSEPQVVLYPVSNGQVDLNNAYKQSAELKEGSLSIHAVPYFFSLSDNLSAALSYDWRQNGAALQSSPEQPTELTFTVEKGMKGVSNIDLSVKNREVLMQSASNNLQINFGQ